MTRITKRVVAGASVAALFVAVGAFVAVTRNHSASPLRQRLGGGTGTRFVASRATVPSAVANLPPGFIERNELDPGAVRHLGPFPTKRGPLDLYVIPRLDRSKSCVLVLDAKGGGGGGCATDLYHGHAVAWTEGSQGGPEATAVTERYIAGFAKPGVEQVSIVDSAGGLHAVALDAANGFLYEESAPDLKNGLEPAAIVAANKAGVTIDRQSLTNGP